MRRARSAEWQPAAALGQLLKARGLTLAVAESCTGGLIGDMLTDVPASSEYFAGGVIAYANAAKVALLGVSRLTLSKWGAVSEQTVKEMAAGVCRRFRAQVGLAVSGVAGPGGGTRTKPVGLVYVGAQFGARQEAERRLFKGKRRSVKEQAAVAALELCRRVVEGAQWKS